MDLDTTEILDLSGNCTASLPNYPTKIRYATGQFLDGKVIICGGAPHTSDCYQLSKNSSSFEILSPSMQEKRDDAKSIVIQDHIWVTGGHAFYNRLSSTEFIKSSTTSQSLPMENMQLPEPVYRHAIIALNATTSMLIGGSSISNSLSPKTYYHDHLSKTWKVGPDLIYGRQGHAAGIVTDHITHQQHIVVVGGWPGSASALDRVELMFHGENQWQKGI